MAPGDSRSAVKLLTPARKGERRPTDNLKMQNHQILDQFDFNVTSQMHQHHEVAPLTDFPGYVTADPIVPYASIDYPFYDMLGGMENDLSLFSSTAFQLGDHYVGSFNHDEEEANPLLTPPNSDPPQTMQRRRPLTPNSMSPLSATNIESTTMCTTLPSVNTFNSPMGGIDPALLVASSPASGPDSLAFTPLPQDGSAEAAAFEPRSWTPLGVTIRSTTLKAMDTRKPSDLTVAESPIYTRHRHGICRCLSGYCGMIPRAQSGPVARSVPRGDSEHELCNAAAAYDKAKATGRLSLPKSQRQIAALNHIIETETLRSTGRVTRLTTGSMGRARVNEMVKVGDAATEINGGLQTRKKRLSSPMKDRYMRYIYGREGSDREDSFMIHIKVLPICGSREIDSCWGGRRRLAARLTLLELVQLLSP